MKNLISFLLLLLLAGCAAQPTSTSIPDEGWLINAKKQNKEKAFNDYRQAKSAEIKKNGGNVFAGISKPVGNDFFDANESLRLGQSIFLNDYKLSQVLSADPPEGTNLAELCLESGNALNARYAAPKEFAQKLGIEPHPDFLKYGYGVPLYNWHIYSRELTPDQIRSVLITMAIGAAKADGEDSNKMVSSKLLYFCSKLGPGQLNGNFFLEIQDRLETKSDMSMYFYQSLFDGNRELFDVVVDANKSSMIEDVKNTLRKLSF